MSSKTLSKRGPKTPEAVSPSGSTRARTASSLLSPWSAATREKKIGRLTERQS